MMKRFFINERFVLQDPFAKVMRSRNGPVGGEFSTPRPPVTGALAAVGVPRDPEVPETLGEFVKKQAQKRGYHMTDIAERMRITGNTLRSRLNGRTQFRGDEISLLSQLIGVPVSDLQRELK